MISSQLKKLNAADGTAVDFLGFAVAVDGDTVVVGAVADGPGSAYVFERNAGGPDNWGQIKKLTASDAAAGDEFGGAVAIRGNMILVGAAADDDGGTDSGSAYVFERNAGGPDNWGQVKKLTAADAAGNDRFGSAVALGAGTAVVGAPLDDGTVFFDAGSGYVFERNAGGADNWGQVKKLTAADAATADELGSSVSIRGDTLVLGADADDDLGSNSGSVYLFGRNTGGPDGWGLVHKIVAPDGQAGDRFGFSVSIGHDRLAVGANGDDDAGSSAGAAYVFERNAGGLDGWGLLRKLGAADAAAFDEFGYSVALHGDTVVVGAYRDDDAGSQSGSAYVFERNVGGADQWGQAQKLTASDGAANDDFGRAVAISGTLVLGGAHRNDDLGTDSGSAYLFSIAGCEWNQFAQQTTHANPFDGDDLGFSTAISGDTIVAGAPFSYPLTGAAHVFERNAGGADHWGKVKTLLASDAAVQDSFGYSVGISVDTVLVGAPNDDDAGSNSGSAYVFARNAGGPDNWGQIKKLVASGAQTGDQFARSAAISGDTIVVGVPFDDPAGSNSGSVRVFARNAGGQDNWGEVRELTAFDAAADFLFGWSVSIDADTLVVATQVSSVYVFERNAGGADNWGQVRKLSAPLSTQVSISGNVLVAGEAGVYVFERNAGGLDNWGQTQVLARSAPLTVHGSALFVRDTSNLAVLAYERNARGDNWGLVPFPFYTDPSPNPVSYAAWGETLVVGDWNLDGIRIFQRNCPVCGDGLQEVPEQCDDGTGNSDVQPDACRTDCASPDCGDGVTDTGESCDDGNHVGGDGCDADCGLAAVPGEASPGGDMLVSKAGSAVGVSFAPACAATGHAAYWGVGPIAGAPEWIGSACGLGTTGTATFDPGAPGPGESIYFVVVARDGDDEGSYGVDSAAAPRPEALGIGACDRPAGTATCP